MIFEKVQNNALPRNFFNLSYEKKFTADMGFLYPIYVEECVAGDRVKLSNEIVVRFQPLVAPVLHSINCKTEYFFVPFRLLWNDWESFFTGGKDGTEAPEPPLWDDYNVPETGTAVAPPKNSLWDFFGLPLVSPPDASDCPLSFARTAYNLIWNEYYRDENVDAEVSLDQNDVLLRRWKKDYFTSALPFQQRGISPSFPLAGEAPVTGSAPVVTGSRSAFTGAPNFGSSGVSFENGVILTQAGNKPLPGINERLRVNQSGSSDPLYYRDFVANATLGESTMKADMAAVSTFDISDLRLANQMQKFLELAARGGYRYDEFLLSMFGVSCSDSRLNKPEFLGGSVSPLLVSEVLQTSETTSDSPQGNLAGRGMGASKNYIAKFTVPEPGLVIGLFSICPVAQYNSQGISKMWTRRSRFDFYWPQFAHLSEQPVLTRELYMMGNHSDNVSVFGYQAIYDEYRFRHGEVCGDMRDVFDYWSLARKFASKPVLNSDFLKMDVRKDIFAVQDEPGFICDVYNVAKFVRFMPKFGTPGGALL